MARQVLPWVGAVVGNFIAPGVGAQWGFAIGSMVGNVVDPMVLKAPSIGDGQTQTSQEGVPINRVYGTACCGGNIIARGDLKKITKRTSQGKGGPVQEEERFLLTYAIGITGHEIGGILRIWEDEKLVYDVRPEGSQVNSEENMKYARKFRLFLGTPDQQPSSDLEIIFGAGDTPAYRNRSYIVFPENDVTDRRGSIPNYRFEVTTSDVTLSPSLFLVSAGYRMFDGVPGTYMLLPDSTSAGGSFQFWNTCSTSNGKFFVDASNADFIRVYKRREDNTDWDVNQEFPWDFTHNNNSSIRMQISFNKDEKFLIIHYLQESETRNRRLVSLPFDPQTGIVSLTPSDDLYLDHVYFGLDTQLNDAGSRTEINLSWSPSGRLFSVSYSTTSGNRSVAIIEFDNTNGTFGPVNRQSDACAKTVGDLYIHGWFAGENFFIVQNNQRQLKAYNIWGNGFDCDSPTHPQNFWGVTSSVSIPTIPYNYRECNFSNGRPSAFLSHDVGRNVLMYSGIVQEDPGKSFPWTYFDNVTGLFGGINYSYIPTNYSPSPETAGYHALSISGDGNYLCAYASFSSNHDENVILHVLQKNHITDSFETVQELTRKQILDFGSTVSSTTPNTVISFSGSQYFAAVTGKAYLANIIRDVADLCEPGLDEKLDITELEGKEVDGFVIGQQYSARNVISSLQQTHFFDPSEYDEKVNFVVRGKAVSQVITEQDLVDEDPWSQLRKSSIEYPKTLNLLYQNAISGYDTAKATAMRSSPSVQVSGEKTIEVPEVLGNDRAAQVADIQMKIAWAEAAGNFNFTVPASWYDTWVTSDVVGLYLGDTGYRLRIEKLERADGELKVEASIDRQSAYTSTVTGLPPRAPTPPPPTIAGRMEFVYLNIPALLDSNDVLGYYVATSGTRTAYTGGTVERRHAGIDEDFSTILTTNSGRTVAHLLSPIAASSEHYVDTTNVLHIKVFGDDFEAFQSVSNDVLLRENNAVALVNGAGEAEIIQYRDVESLGDGEYKLSHLLRGRLNTTPKAFSSADRLAVLDDVHMVVVDGSEIGTTFEHRATAYGENPLESPTSVDSFSQPLMQTEFPVDLLRGDLSGSTLSIEWSPRERFGSDINPIRSVNWASYRVTITDGTTTQTVDVQDPQHTADVSGMTGTVTVSVSQVNRLTGPGPSKSIQIVV